jgi:hypothetical protein
VLTATDTILKIKKCATPNDCKFWSSILRHAGKAVSYERG